VPATPATQVLTPEAEEEIGRRYLQSSIARAQQEKERRDLHNLLSNGTAEEVAEYTRKQYADAAEASRINAIAEKAASDYAESTLLSLLSPEFIDSLTPEEAQALLPDKYADDRSYIAAITQMRETKARTGLYDDEEVERRVAERLKGQQNVQRGQQFSQSSATQIPSSTASADRHAGLEGNALKQSLWGEVKELWGSEE
jgi:CHAT domain-containing protein